MAPLINDLAQHQVVCYIESRDHVRHYHGNHAPSCASVVDQTVMNNADDPRAL